MAMDETIKKGVEAERRALDSVMLYICALCDRCEHCGRCEVAALIRKLLGMAWETGYLCGANDMKEIALAWRNFQSGNQTDFANYVMSLKKNSLGIVSDVFDISWQKNGKEN